MKVALSRPVVARPCHRRRPIVKAAVDPVEVSKHVGKGLTLWVLFTSTLNWLYYRDINK